MAKAKRVSDYNGVLAVRLRECMERKGITQKELSDSIGKTRQAVNFYTLGETVPDADTLIKISNRLDVSVDYLLGLSDAAALDTSVQDIHKLTGLSEKAIDMLISINEPLSILDSLDKNWIDTISFLLETAQRELSDGLLQNGILPVLTDYLMNGIISSSSDLYIVEPTGQLFKTFDEAKEYTDNLGRNEEVDITGIIHTHTGEYIDIIVLNSLMNRIKNDRKLYKKKTATNNNNSVAE